MGKCSKYQYRWEAVSVTGFVQQLATNLITKGYRFYVTGHIPEGKDVAKVDERILSKYDIAIPWWTRSRRKKNGRANLQYLRYDHFFILIATNGYSRFFSEEEKSIRDIREVSVKFHDYDISSRLGGRLRMTAEERELKKKLGRGAEVAKPDTTWRTRVMIEHETYRDLEAHLLELSTKRSADNLRAQFWNLPFEPYAPVRQQLFWILSKVNDKRKTQGLEKLKTSCIRVRRNLVKPFGEWEETLKPAA